MENVGDARTLLAIAPSITVGQTRLKRWNQGHTSLSVQKNKTGEETSEWVYLPTLPLRNTSLTRCVRSSTWFDL